MDELDEGKRAVKALELRCACGGATKIIGHKYDERRQRRRACSKCGIRFTTYEVSAQDWRILRDFQRVLRRHRAS